VFVTTHTHNIKYCYSMSGVCSLYLSWEHCLSLCSLHGEGEGTDHTYCQV